MAKPPTTIDDSSVFVRDRDEGDQHPDRRRRRDREPHLVVRPGDRVENVDDDRRRGQRDHDQDERQVAQAAALGTTSARWPSTPVSATSPRIASSRPSALRTRISSPIPPIA